MTQQCNNVHYKHVILLKSTLFIIGVLCIPLCTYSFYEKKSFFTFNIPEGFFKLVAEINQIEFMKEFVTQIFYHSIG